MTTVLSSKGQVVLAAALRRALGLVPGTVFSVRIENEAILLEPFKPPGPKSKIVKDRRSKFSVLSVEGQVPPLTNERVRDMLADFP